jgi:CubicO group peptidase (beta-lactamase class C family)
VPLRLALLALVVFAGPARAQTALPPDFDTYVAHVLDAFDVPGASVAIVRDGQTVLTRGYGTRRLGEDAPVDERTRFGIASNSKAFTAVALGMLVEEGRVAWDAPVTRYLPGFALSDPYVTAELTVRDLLVHRSGLSLGAGDLLWWPASALSREETVRRLRALPLATSFRSTYAYDNVLYMVAGEVVEAVSGQTWEAFVQARILDRLGMADTRASVGEGLAGDNVSGTFAPVDGAVVPVAAFDGENANPAAGITSTARDMARWLTVVLDSGRVDLPGVAAGRLFSPATTVQLWTPVTPVPINPYPAETAALQPQFSGYALGFGVRDYRGVKVVSHTGGLPGFVSQVMLVPSLGLGVAVLTNGESGAAFQSITQRVVDHAMGLPETDWAAAFQAVTARREAQAATAVAVAGARRDSLSGPSLPLAGYAGTYTDPWYGAVEIGGARDGLAIRFAHTPLLVGTLEHWQHDTFVARWTDRTLRADAYVTFALHPDGTVREARMRPVSPATDFSFDFQDLVLTPAD